MAHGVEVDLNRLGAVDEPRRLGRGSVQVEESRERHLPIGADHRVDDDGAGLVDERLERAGP